MSNQECYKLKLGEQLYVNVHEKLEYINEVEEPEMDENHLQPQNKEIEIDQKDPI